jgi:hypothetical protein
MSVRCRMRLLEPNMWVACCCSYRRHKWLRSAGCPSGGVLGGETGLSEAVKFDDADWICLERLMWAADIVVGERVHQSASRLEDLLKR